MLNSRFAKFPCVDQFQQVIKSMGIQGTKGLLILSCDENDEILIPCNGIQEIKPILLGYGYIQRNAVDLFGIQQFPLLFF
ncbi:MAG: hypothetical protein CVT99_06605 [Bacteroidetes bacterium HGW-Bacteroidetes-16]|nr:MAG: hypothetical protein CVT99_06605 [Bacteroidetes bacterium HGW-Bacteroidetes-16]